MDCDDVIIPDCIEILYRKMVEHPVDFVAASFVRKDVQGIYIRVDVNMTMF